MVKRLIDPKKLASGGKLPPDRPLEVGKLLFDGWLRTVSEEERRPKAFDTLMRASQAGQCTRRLWYTITNPDQADDATPADRWRMALGTMVHNKIEEDMVPMVLQQVTAEGPWTDIEVEPKFTLEDQGVSCSGSGDLFVLDVDGKRGLIEIKTVNGYKFKCRALDFDGGPAGPETYHLRQLGLAVQAYDADWAVILYVSMELTSPRDLRRAGDKLGITLDDWDKFIAEWVFTRDELQPVIDDEMRRMRLITKAKEVGLEVAKVPRVAVVDGPDLGGMPVTIVDPESSSWEVRDTSGEVIDVGQAWNGNFCNYCPFKRQCIEDGAD